MYNVVQVYIGVVTKIIITGWALWSYFITQSSGFDPYSKDS